MKIRQLEGYLTAGVSGAVALWLLTVILGYKSSDAVMLASTWIITLSIVLAASELATTCRIGWAFRVFLDDLNGAQDEDYTEDEQLVAQEPTTKPVEAIAAQSPLIDRMKLNKALAAIVTRFHEGKSVGRASCVNDGACDQRSWNLANAVLQALGLRRTGQSEFYTTGSLDVDLQVALHGWYLTGHGKHLWITTEGQLYELDLVACNYIQEKKTGA